MDTGSKLPREWLPDGKTAAVCFSIDDLHPGKSTDAYEAGGDLADGSLRHVEWLLSRHPDLRITLFTTADWRELSPAPTGRILPRIPYLRDRVFLGGAYPPGTMRLDRHPEFVAYLKALPKTEIALHGLHHIARGQSIAVEFRDRSSEDCKRILRAAIAIFERAGLPYVRGICPPGWDLTPQLAEASIAEGFEFVASARDIITPISTSAVTAMSGIRGVSLIYPEPVYEDRLLHFAINFQATSDIGRALEIIDYGGLLNVKAHIVKNAMGHVALDGMDALYRNYLDVLFTELERRYADSLWWTSMGEIAGRYAQPCRTAAEVR